MKYAKRSDAKVGGYKTQDEEKTAFWELASPEPMSGCWLWLGGISTSAPGFVYGTWKSRYAHRVAYEFDRGSPPGRVVMHTCDNPMCVNPRHLKSGTQADNMEDKAKKYRGAKKLNPSKVAEIYKRLLAGERGRALACEFGVDPALVYRIRDGEVWQRVTGAPR